MFYPLQQPFMIFMAKAMVALLLVLVQGCSTIPSESVDLSKEVGAGIVESKRSYDALASAYFADKRQQITAWARGEYLETLLRNIFSTSGQSQTLTPAQLRDVLDIVLAEQETKLADLDRTRVLVQAKSDDHYGLLTRASAGVTSLLQSAVKVREASAAAFKGIKDQSGGKIDLAELESKFNDYLKKAGTASNRATSFLEAAKLLGEKKEK